VNHTAKTRPVSDYLALQSRYRHMTPEQVAALQAEIDEGWARLLRQAAASGANAA
jgi:pyruvate/2-oxoacid:ferredoxin oxidoreductase beta subunit